MNGFSAFIPGLDPFVGALPISCVGFATPFPLPSFPHSKVLPSSLCMNDLLLINAERPDGLAKLMQSLGRRYVQYVNRAYKRSGSLWEGRYKSSAVQADDRLTSHPLYQSLGSEAKDRLGSYRALFRSELDEEVVSDIQLALAQSQPLGDDRFTERICAKLGVRRTNARRGRPPGKANSMNETEEQTEFRF